MKKCTKCLKIKPISEFGKAPRYKDGIRSECKKCEKQRLTEWRNKNPDRFKAQWERSNSNKRKKGYNWHSNNKARARDNHLRRTYGLSLEGYNKMYKDQNGKCAACGEDHEILDVDHCHKTGRVRGLLCNRCNRALGMASDNPALVEKLLNYITDR